MTATRSRVAVTGANGFVGGALVSAFRARGFDVQAITRAGRAAPPPAVQLERWDEGELARAFAGAHAVVHAASVVHRPDAADDEYRRFNIEGTRALLAAAVRAGVQRIVFISTIKVYGDDVGSIISEDTPTVSDGSYAETKLEAERLILAAHRPPSPSTIVLRLSPVFGPGDKGNVRLMIRAISRGRFAVPGRGDNRKSIVHISTVCDVVASAIESSVTGAFNVADRRAPSIRELADAIAAALERRPPFGVPAFLLRAAATVAELTFRVARRPAPVTRALIHKSLAPTVCPPDRVERALGVECHVDLAQAIREEVEWMRREALL